MLDKYISYQRNKRANNNDTERAGTGRDTLEMLQLVRVVEMADCRMDSQAGVEHSLHETARDIPGCAGHHDREIGIDIHRR
jgi:hypothetical protein